LSFKDNKKQNVKVTLRTTIDNGSETESHELITFGTKFTKGNDFYLQYSEDGETGKTQTTIKYKDVEALLMRGGAVKMRQLFRPGEMTNGHYESQYGMMPMVTKAISIQHHQTIDADSGQIIFNYELYMQGDSLGRYEMVVAYKEEE
jgi:uncharacterized beta-barrel protein YwiB (DUF1934 family)